MNEGEWCKWMKWWYGATAGGSEVVVVMGCGVGEEVEEGVSADAADCCCCCC